MDLSKLKQLQSNAKEEVEKVNNRGNGNNGPKVLYPFNNGTFRLKLLFDEKSGLLQRKIPRHYVGKNKIPCLGMYGEECPICAKVKEIEEIKGQDSGVFRKYGYKNKGICHAVLINDDDKLFNDQNSPKVGEEVIFMYPIGVYNQINELVVKSGDNIESLLGSNNGKTVEVSRSQKGNGPIDYKISPYAYGDEKVRDTNDEFDALLEGMTPLNDVICPSNPTEDMREQIKSAVETMHAEFIDGSVLNPKLSPEENGMFNGKLSDNKEDSNKDAGKSISESAMNPPIEEKREESKDNSQKATNNNGDKPDCFGTYADEQKCRICPHEVDCIMGQ